MGVMAALLLGFSAGQALAEEAAPATPADMAPADTAASAPAPAATQAEATYVGEKACISCHETENASFTHTVHAKIFRLNPRTETEKLVCEACHGPGSLHAKKTKDKSLLIGFTKEWGTPIETQTARCLACHKGGQRQNWPGSIHQVNKLSCSDCHNPMAKFSATGLLKKPSITETCQSCHKQQEAEFKKRSHMPVPEGKMSCEDCHNPHGSSTTKLLKANSVNEVCYTCHAEKRGPFLWEHAPVREKCINCHQPHGSNHDKLLVSARPYLCSNCHSPSVGHPGTFYNASGTAENGQLTGGAAGQRVIGRSCQNCHSQIHGSNHPAGARFQK